jgi:hypothetical protein
MAVVAVAICAITSPSPLCGHHIGVVDVAMGSRCSGHRRNMIMAVVVATTVVAAMGGRRARTDWMPLQNLAAYWPPDSIATPRTRASQSEVQTWL